jgi:type I restriction enzyme R subunit
LITANQNPEQHVRDEIDKMLVASGWQVQSKNPSPFAAGVGVVAVREYQTGIGPADYILSSIKNQSGL